MGNKKILSFLLVFAAYAVSAGVSYALFTKSPQVKTQVAVTPSVTSSGGKLVFNPALPKTENCPLNGALYSKEQRSWWEKHRPLGIMIENHEEAHPQSGLSFADVIYEAVAEGGITRFLAVFYCQDANEVGPVRSARTYFLDFISEYGDSPLYAHVGGANQDGPADALSQITDYGWTGYNDLNQFSIGFPTFWRDYDRLGHPAATEHTMYSTTEKLWGFAGKERKLSNLDKDGNLWSEGFTPYSFKDDEALSKRPVNQTIHLEFWTKHPDYFVDWVYEKNSNSYNRKNGGVNHLDRNNNKQLNAKNIIVLFMKQSSANDGYEGNAHLLYKTRGVGNAVIFRDGIELKGTWRKDSRIGKTLLFDLSGNEIKLNRGLIWFEILPTDGVVNVK